jgi:hypothetical protein
MRISKISVKLLIVAMVLSVGTIFFFNNGVQIRSEAFARLQVEEAQIAQQTIRENPDKIHFGVYGGNDEIDRNWAENLSVALLILTVSALLGAVWLRKR